MTIVRAFVFLAIAGRLLGAQDRLVLTRADIEAAGWQRVSELLDAAPGWRLTSTDRFTYTASADGLPLAGASGAGVPLATILVDGARIPVTMLGTQELEFIPVVLAQLDSVVFDNEPAIIGGRVTTRGAIRFYTRHPPPGFSGRGTYQVGDVSNKPGLYQYTPYRPVNREHIGPNTYGLLGFGGAVGVDIGIRTATLNTTDSLILQRSRLPVTAANAQINLVAPIAHLSIGKDHSIVATHAHYAGLFFVPAYGHEQALRMNATSVAGAGAFAVADSARLSYSAAYTSDDVTPHFSSYPSTLTHRRQNANASAEVAMGRAAAGVALDHWRVDRIAGRSDSSRTEETLFARFAFLGATLTHAGEGWTWGLAANQRFDRGADQLSFNVTVNDERPDQDGAWVDPYLLEVPTPRDHRRVAAVDASWRRTLPHQLNLIAALRATRVDGWTASVPSDTGFFELRGANPPAPIAGTLSTGSARIGVETRHGTRAAGRLLYTYTSSLGGDDALETAARSVARHQVNGSAWFSPALDWRVSSLVQMVSSTFWEAYPALPTGWPRTVPGYTRIDLGVEKWMWSRHIRLHYTVRDILNDSERWHPRGAEFNLRWLATGEIVFGRRD